MLVSTIFVARKTVVSPHTRMLVSVNSSATGLLQLEPKTLGPDFTMLHAALEIVQSKERHILPIIFSNTFAKPRRSPKQMVVSHNLEKPFFLVSTNDVENTIWLHLEGTASTVAVVHYELKKTRENQMKRHEKPQSFHSQQNIADWRQKIDFSDSFSQYR